MTRPDEVKVEETPKVKVRVTHYRYERWYDFPYFVELQRNDDSFTQIFTTRKRADRWIKKKCRKILESELKDVRVVEKFEMGLEDL